MTYTTDMYEGMVAETIVIEGDGGTPINAYYARPLGPGPFPSIVLIHHMPGWDEWYREATRKMAHHGYNAISPNLYSRIGHGTIEDVMAKVRANGGVPDSQVVGDVTAAARYVNSQPTSSGKVGVMGSCSGGRHAYLAACTTTEFDACVDLWGGGVVMEEKDLTANRPVSPLDYTKDLACPLLGIFGDQDKSPTPEQATIHEEELKKHGKDFEFHMYAGAGHGFFYYDRAAYRQEQAVDGWNAVFAFLERHLS